ncbi:hypothetical protein HOY80DRAFT_1009500 [Tuber brumale]|nr:hypothetical protein HOY80DRAFT_1009500 [Tuber brumale]
MSLPTILTSTYSTPKRTKTLTKPPLSLLDSTLPDSAPFEDDERWKLRWDTHSSSIAACCNTIMNQGHSFLPILLIIVSRLIPSRKAKYLTLRRFRSSRAPSAHPSAVVSFALSCDSNLILSCSANPPMIQVHNRLLATTVAVTPRASAASVNICVFHPTRRNIFVLVFNDGVLAAYDYSKISGGGSTRDNGAGIGQGSLKEIHTFRHLHDPSVSGSSGITGVQFLPGHRSRAVTVGEDGRAFLVDFCMRDTLGSWHTGAPATSLTIRSTAAKNRDRDDPKAYLIAVGSVHGWCYVYDGHGNKVGEQIVDAEGGKVLGVEWVAGDICIPLKPETCNPKPFSHSQSHPGSEPPTKVRGGLRARTGSRLAAEDRNPPLSSVHQPATPKGKYIGDSFQKLGTEGEPEWNDVEETASQGYMRLFSPVKKKRPPRTSSRDEKKSTSAEQNLDPQEQALRMETQRTSRCAPPPLWSASGEKTPRPLAPLIRNDGPIQTPKTVTNTEGKTGHKQGRDWRYTKTTQSSVTVQHVSSGTPKGQPVTDKTRDGKLLSDIRSVRARVVGQSGKPVRGNLALFAPYIPGKSKKERSRSPEVVREMRSNPGRLAAGPRPETSNRARTVGAMDGSSNVGETTAQVADETVTTPDGEATDVDGGSFEADIWLAEGKEARRSRKRKQSNADQAAETLLALDDSGGGRWSLAGSFKSRKTVSWQDQAGVIRDISLARDTEDHSFLSKSSAGSSPKPKSSRQDISTPPHHSPAISSFSRSAPFSLVGMPSPGAENAELRSALRIMAMEMQIAFKSEITDMRAEMSERFRQQDILLHNLGHEVQMVRQENQNLRNRLSEVADMISGQSCAWVSS